MLAKKQRAALDKKPRRRTRGRPSLEQVADIERELLDVALNTFLKYGYGGTSMATIVKVAGVSKTTLYSRYSSKEELFLAIVTKLFHASRMPDRMKEGNASLSLEEGLRAFASRTLEIGMNDIVMGVDRLIYSEAHRFPELAAAAAELQDEVNTTVRDFIADCAKRDGIPCRDPMRPARALMEMVRGHHTNAVVTNCKLSKAEIRAWADGAVALLFEKREDW